MEPITLPNRMTVLHMGTKEDAEKHKQALTNRHNFALKYAKEKGWLKEGDSFEKLSITQIMEVRNQPEWKNPI